jgi:PKD repeat protein
MKKIVFFVFIYLCSVEVFAQDNCQNFVGVGYPSCSCDDCGFLEPNWELLNQQSSVCEGLPFQVSGATSTPLSDIEDFHWYFLEQDAGLFTILDHIVLLDESPVSFTYNVTASNISCSQTSVPLFIVLITTSEDCGNGESCRDKGGSIQVKLKPRAEFNVNQEVCISEAVSFANTSCHANEYEWNFGDGGTSTDENPDHIFATTGTFTVTLIAKNECGEDQTTHQVVVIGEPVAEVDAQMSPPTGCLPLTVFFENISQNVGLPNQLTSSYEWNITPPTGWQYEPDTIYSDFTRDINVQFTTPDEYLIELTIENICGTDTWDTTIVVLEVPTVSLASPGAFCQSAEIDFEDFASYTGSIFGYDWTITPPSGSPLTYNVEYPSGVFTTPGTYQVDLIVDGGPCGDFPASVMFEVQTPGTTSFTNPPSVLCNNDAPVVIDVTPMTGTWTSSPTGISIVNNTINPSNINAGNYTLEFTPNGNCVIANSFNITILEGPELSITSVPVECDELIYEPNVNVGGEYSNITWTAIFADGSPNSSGVVNNVNTLPNVTYNIEGENFYVITLEGDCGIITDTISIEIQANTSISITPPPSLLCNTSSPIQLIASPTTGTWEPSSLVTSDGIFDPVQSGAGTFSLTYSTANGACEDEQTIQVTVIEAAPVTLEENVILCVDSDPYTLTFDPLNGVWSGDGISDVNLGVFNPQSVGAGTYELTYELQDMSGCEVVKTTEVIVEGFPEITLLPNAQFCVTDEDIDLVDALNLDVNPIGGTGTWSGTGIVDPTNGLFNSGQTDTGTFIITYTYVRNDCEISDSVEINVIEAPIAEAGDDFSVCIDDGTLTLVGTPAGGTWGPSTNIDTNTGAIDLNGVGGGTFNFTYTVQPGTTCEDADMATVEIIDLAANLDAGNNLVICEGDPSFQLSGFTPVGEGTWSGMGVSASGMVTTSQLQPDSTYTLSYCLENQNLGCEACDEILLTVNSLPEASFQITSTTCINEPIVFENLSLNGCTYDWDFGDGNTSNLETPTHIYTSTGTYNITLTTYSCEDCIDIFQMEVFVTEPPTAFFDTNVSEGCAVLAVAFDNQSFGTSISFFWDFGNGQTSTEENPDTVFFQQTNYDTTYIIELAVTNECGTRYHYDSVTVFPLPVVIMGTNVDDGCSPLEIEFANLTLGNPETYAWYIDGVLASTDSLLDNQIFTTSDTAITYYEITLISNNFCGSDTLDKTITVYPPDVDAFMQVDTTKGCQPLTVTFTNFSTPGATITYDFGDGNGSSDENPIYTFNDAGVFTVYQYAANCGVDTDSIVIEVLPAPQVSFIHDPYVCQGQPITFTNTSIDLTGGVWDFGDGSLDTLSSPTHIFAVAGIYNISYTGYSAVNACPATFTSTLEVLGNPEVSFTPSVIDGCVPLTINFVNTSIGATYYEWEFDFGNSSNETNPTHTFNTPGTYGVTLIGTDNFGCFMDTTIVNIIVHDIPTSEFQTDAEEYCSGVDSISVTNNSSADAVSYSWDFGDGQVYTDFEPTVLLLDTGEQLISLTVENTFGCQHSFSQLITVLGTPQALVSNPITDYVGCEPLGINFINTSNFTNQYEWNFGNGNTSTDEFPSHIFLNAGTYPASLVAINTNGCPNDTLEFEVQVNPNPISDFEVNADVICGIPDSLVTTFTGSVDALDFSWVFGDGSISDETNPSHEYTVQGDYEVSLIIGNIHGCLDTASQIISVNEQPFAEIDPFQYEGCEPDTVQFFSGDPFADSWQWSFGDGTFSNEENPLHPYPQHGVYDIELILGNNNLCFDTLFILGSVTILESPTAFFTWTDLTKGFIAFTNGSTNAIEYKWDFDDGNSSTAFEPTHEYITNGEKIAMLTAIHENGCLATYEVPVMPNYFYGLYVPNAFSPETGIGDVRLFKPAGIGLKEYHISVFSPWGELLWQSKEIIGEQPSEYWDGFYKGKLMPQGAYVWKVNVEFVNGATDIMTGTVILLK